MPAQLKFQAPWSDVETRLRLVYRDWARHRIKLARSSYCSDAAQDNSIADWSKRQSELLHDVESGPRFVKNWSDRLSASGSAIRAHYVAEFLRSGYSLEGLLEQVTKHMEKELRLGDEMADHAQEMLEKREFVFEKAKTQYSPWFDFYSPRHKLPLLEQYEEILPQYGLPVRIEPMVEAALYAIYVALSPRSRVVVPRNHIELIRGLTVEKEFLRVVSPRQFEELLFYLYEALGCRAALSPATRDWGADVLAWHPGPFNTESLIVVQAKLYSPKRKVSLAGVHALHGAVTHYNATTGHLVSTAELTGPAQTFMDKEGYRFINTASLGEEVDKLLSKWTHT